VTNLRRISTERQTEA